MTCTHLTTDEIQERVKQRLTPKRYRHSLGVRDCALELAARYGCEEHQVIVASLLHDIARDLPDHELFRIIREEEPTRGFTELERRRPVLLHGLAGSLIARREFHVQDVGVLRSIEHHTTGAAGMSLLERIVFVADYIEPGRSMEGVREARALAGSDLEGAELVILKSVFKYLLGKNRIIAADGVEAYNEIIAGREI
jgi:predicted HD superfamily hydrolase involved in NAD metabolism